MIIWQEAQDTSDDSAIIEDDAPDGNSSNSDPSTLLIVQDTSKKVRPFSTFKSVVRMF